MLEFLFELLGEFVLQVFSEVLLEFGLQALIAPFRKQPNPWLAVPGYLFFGALAGGISLWLVPSHLVRSETLRLVNLGITPLLAGSLMAAIGVWRARRGDTVLRIDRFGYGYLFALAMGLVRFWFGV